MIDGSRSRPWHHEQPTLPDGEPVKPDFLSDVESAQWDCLVGVLQQRGHLTADVGEWLLAAAGAYDAMMKWRAAAAAAPLTFDKFTADGAGIEPRTHPAHVQLRLARKAYVDVLKEAGLTPATVSRVVIAKKPDEASKVDPLNPFDRHLAAARRVRNGR